MADPVTAKVLSQDNQPAGEIQLTGEIFDAPLKRSLLHSVVRMQLANRRAGTHATKTRAFVRGGGKKPWRQKGTGRARSGSSRSPIWVGGATVFGPQPRDYSYRMPRSARIAALRSAISDKLRDGQLIIVDKLELEAPKTKLLAQLLQGLGIDNALIVVADRDESLERAGRNLPKVKVLRAGGANVYDILRYHRLVLTRGAVEALEQRLAQ
ncbi:MAG TPA: 50S ribosomal protein L4 [Terriglobales bacterium]|nr:50S ribosomal protein L4 [Terriglobales bacterium]